MTGAALWLSRDLQFAAVALLWGGGGLAWLLGAAYSPPWRLLRGAAVVAALSGVGWLATTLLIVTGDPGSLLDLESWTGFFAASFGPAWAIRLALLAMALVLAIAPPRRATIAALTLVGAGLAVDQVWLGHAAATVGAVGVLAKAADALHVIAAYAWVGALPVLVLALRHPARAEAATRALALFSSLGILAVAAILASGLVNAATRIGAPTRLLASVYGEILTVKIALFLGMVVFAVLNRTSVTRQGERRRLILGVTIETGLGVLTLAAAALLGMTEPPMP